MVEQIYTQYTELCSAPDETLLEKIKDFLFTDLFNQILLYLNL